VWRRARPPAWWISANPFRKGSFPVLRTFEEERSLCRGGVQPCRQPQLPTCPWTTSRGFTAAELGGEKLYRTGYRYYTTSTPRIQAAAQEGVTRDSRDRENGSPCRRTAAGCVGRRGSGNRGDDRHGRKGGLRGNPVHRAADRKNVSRGALSAFRPPHGPFAVDEGQGDKTLSAMVSGEPVSIPTPEGIWVRRISIERRTERSRFGRQSRSLETLPSWAGNDVGLTEVLKTARAAGITSPLSPLHRWHWEPSSHADRTRLCIHDDRLRGYPFRPVFPSSP